MDKNLGILVLGHGSRLPYNKEIVDGVAQILANDHPDAIVHAAFMNMSPPTVKEGIESFADTDVDRIVVSPIFLAQGVHTIEDIPRILGLPEGQTKKTISLNGRDVQLFYAKPLGLDQKIADLSYKRIVESLQ